MPEAGKEGVALNLSGRDRRFSIVVAKGIDTLEEEVII
jgi:hypothetical protein